MIWLRSLLFTAFLFLSVIVYASGVLLLAPFGHSVYYRMAVGWARANLWLLDRLCGLRFEVEGMENIPQAPCVLYWKHESVWETMAGALLFPPQTWVVKRELMWLPFFGWGLALLKPIAINRKAGRTAVKQVISQGRERLASGLFVVIYPEGARVLAAGSQPPSDASAPIGTFPGSHPAAADCRETPANTAAFAES